MSKNPLVAPDANMSMIDAPEILYNLMVNAERALQMAGAKPEKDYTYRDLMNFAVEMYKIEAPEDRALI